jgi:hypothetical protein
MNDPERLLQDGPSALEADLLRSVAAERPTFEHRMRVRQAMGIAPGASLPPPPSAGLGVGKMAIAGLVAAGAITALVIRGVHPVPSNASSLSTEQGLVVAPPPAEAPSSIATEPPAPVAEPQALPGAGAPPSPTPRATAIFPAHPARAAKSQAADATDSDIHDQIRLIDEANASLHGGDAKAALRTADVYSTKYPNGALGQEAAVIRIEALEQSGSHARAASLARAFLAKHPTSAHAKRLEGIASN